MDWKFNLYDLFGYLIPGGVVISTALLLFQPDGTPDGFATAFMLTGAAYLSGHLLHPLGEAAIDHGKPSQRLMGAALGEVPSFGRIWTVISKFGAWRAWPEPSVPDQPVLRARALAQLHGAPAEPALQFELLRTLAVTMKNGWMPLLFHSFYALFRTLAVAILVSQLLVSFNLWAILPDGPAQLALGEACVLGATLLVVCWAATRTGKRCIHVRALVPFVAMIAGVAAVLLLIWRLENWEWSSERMRTLLIMNILAPLIARIAVSRVDHFALSYAEAVVRVVAAGESTSDEGARRQ